MSVHLEIYCTGFTGSCPQIFPMLKVSSIFFNIGHTSNERYRSTERPGYFRQPTSSPCGGSRGSLQPRREGADRSTDSQGSVRAGLFTFDSQLLSLVPIPRPFRRPNFAKRSIFSGRLPGRFQVGFTYQTPLPANRWFDRIRPFARTVFPRHPLKKSGVLPYCSSSATDGVWGCLDERTLWGWCRPSFLR